MGGIKEFLGDVLRRTDEKALRIAEEGLDEIYFGGGTGEEAIENYISRAERQGEGIDVGAVVDFMVSSGARSYAVDERGNILAPKIKTADDFWNLVDKHDGAELRTNFPDKSSYQFPLWVKKD